MSKKESEEFKAQTRADTVMPVNELARYMEKPQQKHWDEGFRVLRYLYRTKELGLTDCSDVPPYVINKLYAYVVAT